MILFSYTPSRLVVAAITSWFVASIFAMSAMNFFEAPTRTLPVYLLVGTVLGVVLFHASNVTVPQLSRREHMIALGAAFFLALPRVSYLFEQNLGVAVNAVGWDDWWRIQELSSLSYSPSYPPVSTFDPERLLSFYYAPWIVGAVLKIANLTSTLKPAIFVNHALLVLAASYIAVFASQVLFDRKAHRRLFLLLFFFFGGFEIFTDVVRSIGLIAMGKETFLVSTEWWPTGFRIFLHFPDFVSLSLQTPHHLIAASALLVAAFILTRSENIAGGLLAGTLSAFALFSSVFAFLGAVPFLLIVLFSFRIQAKHLAIAFLWATLLCVPLLWIYLRSDAVGGFKLFGALIGPTERFKALGAVLFLLILLMEFFPLWILIFGGNRMRDLERRDKSILFVALAFLISTFFISFIGTSNNYAGRGSIFSILALFYVAVRAANGTFLEHFRTPVYRAIAVAYLCGGIFSYVAFLGEAAGNFANSFHPFNERALASNLNAGESVAADLVERSTDGEFDWYLLENLKTNPKSPLEMADLELMGRGNAYRFTSSSMLKD